ncbi:MAG: NAD-dependent epimerase/dehydratase family protein [Candidatus Micrarchaeia archaeon]
MKVLVTGGAGFIGSHLVENLLKEGYEVTVLDSLNDYYSPELKQSNLNEIKKTSDFNFFKGDIRNISSVKRAMGGADIVFHEAAQAGVRYSVEHPAITNEINTQGTMNLLVAARDAGIKNFIFASSSSVYGKHEYLPFDENHPTNPISPYGVSKLACEKYCQIFSDLYGMRIPMLRYFTVYGPRMRPDLAISIFMKNAIEGKPIRILGDGSKTRDFTYIDDIISGTMCAMEKGKTGPYNLGGGVRISVLELAQKIISLTGSRSSIEYHNDVVGDMVDTFSDTKKARSQLGWEPKTTLEEGLNKFYNSIKKS